MTSSPMRTQWSLAEIALLVGGEVIGDAETIITGLAGLDEAGPGDLIFAENAAFLAKALESSASAILAPAPPAADSPKALIVVAEPRLAFVEVLEAFAPPIAMPEGIHSSAQIGENVTLGAEVRIGANVTVSNGATLEDGVALFAGVQVGQDCIVGAGSMLHSNVVLYDRVKIGKRCLIHAGCVLGSDGFGFMVVGGRLRKVPHLGSVEIGDEVEIGSNSCIDRAKTGTTYIGAGTKIDNLVHIAHNVRVGMSCVLAGQVGIAGSSTLGIGVMLGGQVGVKDHVSLGDGVKVGAQSGIMRDVAAGEVVFGSPAIPTRQKMRELASVPRLPDALRQIASLERRLALLEKRLAAETDTESVIQA